MRLLNKQKQAVEKVTGKPWGSFPREVLKAYFDYTDRGIKTEVSPEYKDVLFDLLVTHRFHAYTVECWKEDFRKGLLFLSDFRNEPIARQQHAREIYQQAMRMVS